MQMLLFYHFHDVLDQLDWDMNHSLMLSTEELLLPGFLMDERNSVLHSSEVILLFCIYECNPLFVRQDMGRILNSTPRDAKESHVDA